MDLAMMSDPPVWTTDSGILSFLFSRIVFIFFHHYLYSRIFLMSIPPSMHSTATCEGSSSPYLRAISFGIMRVQLCWPEIQVLTISFFDIFHAPCKLSFPTGCCGHSFSTGNYVSSCGKRETKFYKNPTLYVGYGRFFSR